MTSKTRMNDGIETGKGTVKQSVDLELDNQLDSCSDFNVKILEAN